MLNLKLLLLDFLKNNNQQSVLAKATCDLFTCTHVRTQCVCFHGRPIHNLISTRPRLPPLPSPHHNPYLLRGKTFVVRRVSLIILLPSSLPLPHLSHQDCLQNKTGFSKLNEKVESRIHTPKLRAGRVYKFMHACTQLTYVQIVQIAD